MGRIEKAFARRYQELLGELGARDRPKGVRWFLEKARSTATNPHDSPSASRAHLDLLVGLLEKVHRLKIRRGVPAETNCRLYCDAGLGGLARWLRSCGCEAFWTQDIPDGRLVAEARRTASTIVTTDSPLLERRLITQGHVRAIWVPPTLTVLEQLKLVRAELGLSCTNDGLESRCMRCGGELERVSKEAARERIPPRTYRWLDEFFECSSCGQLFWNGTHWRKIQQRLQTQSS